MNIAFFTDTFDPQVNGVSHAVRDLATALAEAGHGVMILSTMSEGAKRVETVHTASGATFAVHRLRAVELPVYSRQQFTIPGIHPSMYWIWRFKPDVIHVVTPFGVGWEGVWIAKTLGLPVVGTHHTFYGDYTGHVGLEYSWIRPLTLKYVATFFNRCDAVTSPSESLAVELRESGVKPIVSVIPNIVNLAPMQLLRDRGALKERFGQAPFSMVYMGRLSYEKSLEQTIQSMILVMEQVENEGKPRSAVSAMIIGDGPERAAAEKIVADAGRAAQFQFTGVLRGADLYDAVAANSVFISASVTENQPISMIEAMALGLPVVGVRAKGVPEIVIPRKTGMLADTNDPHAIADMIMSLYRDPVLLRACEQHVRTYVERFTATNILPTVIDLYHNIMEVEKEPRNGDDE